MKTLILVRHAKSDKSDPLLNDFDRPLNHRGERDTSAMAGRFAATSRRVDALISSPAVRALSTAEVFAGKLSLPVQADQRIYEAGVNELLAVVRGLDDHCSSVMLVGHNPGLSEFLRYLTDEKYADLPTASVAVVELPVKVWRHTFAGKGVLKSSLSPEKESLGFQHEGPVPRWTDRVRFWRFQRAYRLEIIAALVIGFLLLMLLVPLLMHRSVDESAMPQQGSTPR
jgi:phosphohistidine phosphatase